VRAVTGKRAEARKILNELKAEAKRRHVSSAYAALVHLGLGDVAEALDRAEEAWKERSGFLTRLKVDPLLDPLRRRPRLTPPPAAAVSRARSRSDERRSETCGQLNCSSKSCCSA
jgi:hypothetical protein